MEAWNKMSDAISIQPFTRPDAVTIQKFTRPGASSETPSAGSWIQRKLVIYFSGPSANGPLDGYYFNISFEDSGGTFVYQVPGMRKATNNMVVVEQTHFNTNGGVMVVMAAGPEKGSRDYVARVDYSTRMIADTLRFLVEPETEIAGSSTVTDPSTTTTDSTTASGGATATVAPGGVGGSFQGQASRTVGETENPRQTSSTVNKFQVKTLALRQIGSPPR